jgi:thiol-disulfide isomerase/thioredoxin
LLKSVFIFFYIIVCINTAIAGKLNDFVLKDLNNKRTSYSDLKGDKLTVLDFWATWCKPCARSIPGLILIYEENRENGVQVIGISVDSPRNLSKVKPYVSSKGITYPILLDSNSELISQLQVTAMPTLLIVDHEDEIIFVHRGYRPGDEEVIKEKIGEFLAEKSAESEDE